MAKIESNAKSQSQGRGSSVVNAEFIETEIKNGSLNGDVSEFVDQDGQIKVRHLKERYRFIKIACEQRSKKFKLVNRKN